MFKSQKAIDTHIILGNCSHNENNSTVTVVTEKAKHIYSRKVNSLFPTKTKNLSLPVKNVDGESKLSVGWAAKEPKSRSAFSDRQKGFMIEKFEYGKMTGRKVDPYLAAEEMRICGKFKKEEFLSGQQICSFFSRLCQAEKNATPADWKAIKHEEMKDTIKLGVEEVFKN